MKVSVIIPTHNRDRFIGRAIRSLLDQSWNRSNYEIIVVNDGSTDHTRSVLNAFGDQIKVIDMPENGGLPRALNLGIKNALSRFIVRVDDDDYVHEDFLKTLYSFLAMNSDFDAVCCDYNLVDEKDKVITRKNAVEEPIACGIMFRKDNLIDVGLYDEQFLVREDEDLRMRYLQKFQIHRIPLPLYRYMMHGQNMTSDKIRMQHFQNVLNMKHSDGVSVVPLEYDSVEEQESTGAGTSGFNIGGREITKDSKTFIIAEAGVNYYDIAEQRGVTPLEAAKLMIWEAAAAGADAIKFQIYKADKLASVNSPAYWDTDKERITSQHELFSKFDKLSFNDYRELAVECSKRGIIFSATPFDLDAADLVEELSPFFKIASADITNIPLLEHVAAKGKPMVLSVGASEDREIRYALERIAAQGNRGVCLLHCVLNYPTRYEDANLSRILHLQKAFPEYLVGYSDHTLPDEHMHLVTAAVALGSRIVEKHFTLDKNLPGNDHYHAMDPTDLRRFRRNIDFLHPALGSGSGPMPSEQQAVKYARRSIVIAKNLIAGTVLTEEHLDFKRPGTGISPAELTKVLGKRTVRDLEADTILQWDDFERG